MQQIPGPPDCLLGGACLDLAGRSGPPPGLIYLAMGLIALGLATLWRERQASRRDRVAGATATGAGEGAAPPA
jgi:MYXO-CTERM domain-containing protein